MLRAAGLLNEQTQVLLRAAGEHVYAHGPVATEVASQHSYYD